MITLFLLISIMVIFSLALAIWLFVAGFWYLDIFVAILFIVGIIKLIKSI